MYHIHTYTCTTDSEGRSWWPENQPQGVLRRRAEGGGVDSKGGGEVEGGGGVEGEEGGDSVPDILSLSSLNIVHMCSNCHPVTD
eukprot:1388008-Amorphochlora_amoeboformis.AAC.1